MTHPARRLAPRPVLRLVPNDAPSCDRCGSVALRITTKREGYGYYTRAAICEQCGHDQPAGEE